MSDRVINRDPDDHTHLWWACHRCGKEVHRYRGMRSASCECGAQYSPSGQRFRDDWRDNPSNYDDNVGDMEGYEIEQLRKGGEL